MTVDDIIEVMNEQGGCESEEDREMEVKTNDAIIGLDNVVKYIQQNNLGISAASLMRDQCKALKGSLYTKASKRRNKPRWRNLSILLLIDFPCINRSNVKKRNKKILHCHRHSNREN